MAAAAKPSAGAMKAYLDSLRTLVLDEAIATQQRVHKIWARSLADRVAQGLAIEGVRLQHVHQDGHIDLICVRNESRFRAGDMLLLSGGDPFQEPRFLAKLEQDNETELTISCLEPGAVGALGQGQVSVLDEGYLDLSQWLLDAIDEMADSLIGRQRILPFLLGATRPQIASEPFARGLALAEAYGLNWSQQEALANGYAADLSHLIQGPPGTGKTLVLAHLAAALAGDGRRVLVTAFTHRAINNALNKLFAVHPTVPAIKIGDDSRADDLRVPNHVSFAASSFVNESGGYVIGATPFATRTSRLAGVEFDTVIFDEASQITLPLAIMGMLAGQKYIFIGDQHQLPPVLLSRGQSSLWRQSVFANLLDRGFATMLDTTYRLNQTLVRWPNRHFYEGELKPAPAAADRYLELPRPPLRLEHILDGGEPLVFWDWGQRNTTTRSHVEANAVVDLIVAALDAGLSPSEIGVVAPYRAQGRLIRNLLGAQVSAGDVQAQIVVDTVERMQGQERDLIILSLATSQPGFAASVAEFFFQPQRLNVAVTRARNKLVIVGSRHVVDQSHPEPAVQAGIDLLRDLLAECVRYSGTTEFG